jgi:hypothetical protein
MVQSLVVKVLITSSKELPAGLGLRSANSILSVSLDLRSTSIINLSASLGLRTAKVETKAITEMISTMSKSNKINNALPSTTSLLPHFNWLLHLLIGYQKPFQTNHTKPYVVTESIAKCHSPFS